MEIYFIKYLWLKDKLEIKIVEFFKDDDNINIIFLSLWRMFKIEIRKKMYIFEYMLIVSKLNF